MHAAATDDCRAAAGDSGHRVVLCVSRDRASLDAEFAVDDRQPGDSSGAGGTYRGGGAATEGADLSSVSHVHYNPQTVAGVPAKGIAKLMAPKPAMCGHDLEVAIDSLVFLGHPTVVDQKQQAPAEASPDAPRPAHRETLTTFTFVLVVQVCVSRAPSLSLSL